LTLLHSVLVLKFVFQKKKKNLLFHTLQFTVTQQVIILLQNSLSARQDGKYEIMDVQHTQGK